MEKGSIIIQRQDSEEQLSVTIQLAEGTVWMTKHEIADLFDVYIQTVTSNLKGLFLSQELTESEVTLVHKYKNKNGLEYSTTFYNLEAIIALSFRMKGGICRTFRKCMIERIKRPIIQGYKQPIIIQLNQTGILN